MTGWIKLHRRLLDWEWYKDTNTKTVFIHLLLAANVNDGKYMGISLERGQVVAKLSQIANETGLSLQTVRTAVNRLKSTGEITIKSTNKFSLITIVKYGFFQDGDAQANIQTTNKQHSNNIQTTNKQHSNNIQTTRLVKELKNKRIEEDNRPPLPPRKRTRGDEPPKTRYAEFVSMTNDEYTSLVTKLGERETVRCIEILDNYKGANGKEYASDYRAILNWVVKRYREEETAARASHGKIPSNEARKETVNERNNRLLDEFFGGGEVDDRPRLEASVEYDVN